MPSVLLPNTASPFKPRSAPSVVLSRTVEPWLTATLKRINRVKRPLNSAPQHMRCLTETLSSPGAIWNLCSLIVSRAPESQLFKHSNTLVASLQNTALLHIQAYVVHIDLVLEHEVAFKLSVETIRDLVAYHKHIYLVDQEASTWDWSEKESQIKKLQDEFVQTVNRFVYRTPAIALEGIEEDGAGELLCGKSEEVKSAVQGFFLPLLPPPPRVTESVRPPPTSYLSTSPGSNWWAPTLPSSHIIHPVEPWKVIPSTPVNTEEMAPLTSNSPMQQPSWVGLDMSEVSASMGSPGPHYITTSQPYYPSSAMVPQMPPANMMMPNCNPGMFGFAWNALQDFGTTI